MERQETTVRVASFMRIAMPIQPDFSGVFQ
jgi:hypothetical protein